MKYIILLLTLVSLGACSVKEAGAPTAPPETENKVFNLASMVGSFCHSDLPKVFLWPTSKDGKALSYDEQSVSRQLINKHNDDMAKFNEEKDLVKQAIDSMFLPSILGLKAEFKSKKCYSYCDPDVAFFCDQTDDTVTEIDDGEWKSGDNRIEHGLIVKCQRSQAQRKESQKLCNAEYSAKYDPVNKKAGDAALSLLKAVGNENYFTDFSEVKYRYENNEVFVSLKFGDLVYSTEATDDLLKITEAKVDPKDGYLSFNLNAIDLEDDNRVYGQFKFDLEFIFKETGFRFDGDFKLMNYDDDTEKIGRVSMAMSRSSCTDKNTDIGRCE